MQTVRKSLMISASLLVIDFVFALTLTWLEFALTDVLGNLLFLETATLFMIGGILDFGTSAGITQLRKLLLSSKESLSLAKRQENERNALVFFVAGIILLSIMIVLALFDLSVL
jgi:hypothetical protein